MPARAKIETMPAEVREWIERALMDGRHGGYEALAATLREQGHEISKSALHRHDAKLQRVMERIKASTEAARLITSSAPDDADEHSAAVIRMVQSQLFDALVKVSEADEIEDPAERVRLLASAARAVAEASRASIAQKRWQDEVGAKLKALEREAGPGRRLDADTLRAVREALYG